MIGILLVTHGGFADGLKSAVELIAGKQEQFQTVGLYYGDSMEKFTDKILETINNLNCDKGILVFVDILGGSPSNVILKLLKDNNFKAIAGVNMPMVCHAVLSRKSDIELEELFKDCLLVGKDALISLNNVFSDMQEDIKNDF
ncbi:PTS sugar transporter subunit IIA [Pectinatus frisingensis]|uniref:PTS sugar transporter subunit IIA n=1 Tax=Pectinatus frisingensis TaxID=865 RepID=UPI0018C69EC8|nr:PTS sugar transporter subunit IIA [Pectinatus frisingensis]